MKGNRISLEIVERLFTRQERLALVFLLALSFGGLAVLRWQKLIPARPSAPLELKVRMNTATAEETAALPGIGPVLAGRIIEDRKIHGRFLTLEDLRRVKGVTSKTLEKIQGLVRFD